LIQVSSRRISQRIVARAAILTAAALLQSVTARADDLATIDQRVTAQLLSSAPSTSSVQSDMNSLQSNGSWSDINYSNTAQTNWVPLTHLDRLEAMSQIYQDSSSSLFHNATLQADISNAFNFWISANPMSTNWFDNDIAAPQALGSAMVLISSTLSSTQISEGQTILGRAAADIHNETGQNVVDEAIAGIDSAIVADSSAAMTTAFGEIGGTITVVPGNGIQSDDSYMFHGPQLYMGGYGTSYINDTLNWSSIAAGTSFAISTTQEHLLVDYLLNGTQWFARGQTLDLTADGRQVTFPSYVGAGDGYVGAINNALALGTYRTTELQAFLARQQATISSGVASSTVDPLSGNRDFFDTEIMVQQRPAYYASVKVTSTRTSQPETGNNQGLENLYLGDGVNQIMVTGNEYLGIQPDWNWRRLPGTTVEQDTRSLTPPGTFGATKGTTTYAGGVSDGTYGAEAFSYNRFDVAAQKSWFFFDNEEVALGAAIKSSSTAFEVDTTLNQCLLTSTVSYETTASSTVQTLTTGTVTPTNLKWVYQGGVGYFFITPISNATISAVAQSGNWAALNTAASSSTVTQNVFTLYIDHGTAVSNGSYSYIAVPGIAESAMDAYSAANPIQVIRNDATVQAVRQSTLDLTQAAFYAADSFAIVPGQTLAASAPSTVMLQRNPDVLKLSASSPQALQMALNLTLTGVTLSGSSSTWFDALGNAVAGFNLPGGNLAASTVGLTLNSNGNATPTVSLTSNDQVSNNSYTVSAAVALPANTTFSTDSFSTLAFSNTISGTASITKTGAGALTLSSSNTFTNGVTINAGSVRATSASALGPAPTTINTGGTLVVGASPTNPIVLSGGTLAFTGSPSMSDSLTAAPSTTSTIEIFDPLTPTTPVNVPFTGNLLGSGNIVLTNATGTTSPDGGQAFRINSANTSTFSGSITLSNNVKGELFGTAAGTTTPAGTGSIILTAGDAALGATLNTLTTTAGYSELNLRNNSTGNQVYGNNIQITGIGLAILNPLGTAPAGSTETFGTLTIGNGQQLGIYLAASSVSHPIIFQNVVITSGIATFSPKTPNFGASTSTGSDLYLGPISDQSSGAGITMAGLRTLFLTGTNTYNGPTNITSGILQLGTGGTTGSLNPTSTITLTGGASTGNIALTIDRSDAPTLANPIILSGANTDAFINIPTGNSSTLTGNISGSAQLWASGGGTLILNPSTPNTYTTGTVIQNGTLSFNNFSSLGSGPIFFTPTSNIETLQYTGPSISTSQISQFTFQQSAATEIINVSNPTTNLTVTSSLGQTGTGFTKTGLGSLTLSGSNTYTGGTIVNAGNVTFAAANSLPTNTALTIAAGATVTAADHDSNPVIVLQPSTLTNNGLLDLTTNDLITPSGTLSTITAQIKQGLAGTIGITSSTATADTTHRTALGVILNDNNGTPIYQTFDGASVVDGDVLVKYTWYGDADLNGTINAADYQLIDNGFNKQLTGWFNGDFNDDGVINGDDYALIDNAFNTQGSTTFTTDSAGPTEMIAADTAQISIPEPTAIVLLSIASLGLLPRKRRRTT
jgi:autotransporter-associated beta strand protein